MVVVPVRRQRCLASLLRKVLIKVLRTRSAADELPGSSIDQVSGEQATIPTDLACGTNERGRCGLRQSQTVVTQGQMSYLEVPNTAATVSIPEVEIHPFLMYSSVI